MFLLNENDNIADCHGGGVFAFTECSMSLELLIGRGLAFCVHPMAAWRVLSTPGRAFVISAYAVGGYVAVLARCCLLVELAPRSRACTRSVSKQFRTAATSSLLTVWPIPR